VGIYLAPWAALAAVAALASVLFLSAVVALQYYYWVPIALALYSLAGALMVAYAARYLLEERARLQIQHAFGHYLAPAIVERLSSDPKALRLAGLKREITVMFADLTGFTAMSGRLSPEALTAKVNRYLGYVVEQVEATGGYVDKFIGDAVMAIWGAPADDPLHAVHAIKAALGGAERIARAKRAEQAAGEEGFSIKIGLHSGDAVVGNVGTEHRYNYTAVGATVNIASRLESVPAHYQCDIVVGPRTEELAREEFVFRELDWVLVKGASARMAIFEPIAERARATQAQRDRVAQYARALKAYREMRFAEAVSLWERLATEEASAPNGDGDRQRGTRGGPAAVMAERAREAARHPPEARWDAVNVLANK
jgi:adenylate cyclase